MKKPFSKPEIKAFKKLLINKKIKILQEIKGNNLKGKVPSSSVGDLVDMTSSLLEEEMSLSASERELQMLKEIDNAVKRIENNTYGICIDTNKPINKNRLKLVPEATRTMEAQEKYEAKLKRPKSFQNIKKSF